MESAEGEGDRVGDSIRKFFTDAIDFLGKLIYN